VLRGILTCSDYILDEIYLNVYVLS